MFCKFYHIFPSNIQKGSSDYELNLGAKLFVDKFIQPQQKFASIIKSSYYSGEYKKRKHFDIISTCSEFIVIFCEFSLL